MDTNEYTYLDNIIVTTLAGNIYKSTTTTV